jgi:hypothetical protein
MIKVIFETMKFSEEDKSKVREAFNANYTSYLGKIMGGSLL